MKNTKTVDASKKIAPQNLDMYFDLKDNKIYVPDFDVKELAAGQEQVEIRGFSHLRAIKNADGAFVGIQKVGREEV